MKKQLLFGLLPILALAPIANAADIQRFIDYVECDGNGNTAGEYVLLDYTPSSNSVVEADVAVRKLNATHGIFCARGSDYSTDTFTLFFYSNQGFRWDYNRSTAEYQTGIVADRKYRVRCAPDGFWLDGVKCSTINVSPLSFTPGNRMMLFASYATALPNTPNPNGNYAKIRLYSFKAWDDDGETLRVDLWPCIDADGNTALYDAVTDTIYQNLKSGKSLTPSAAGSAGPLLPGRFDVTAAPEECGEPSPGYGITTSHLAGESFAVSAPAVWTNAAETASAVCTGWKLYDAEGNVVSNGTGNAFTYTHPTPAAYRRLEWQWDCRYKVAATAGADGSVSPAAQWVGRGAMASVTATPNAGHHLFKWTGDIPSGVDASAPTITLPVTAPATLAATFGGVLHVSPNGDGTDPAAGFATGYATIHDAVAAASAGDVVLLDTETFTLASSLTIDKAIVLAGAGGRDDTVLDGANNGRLITVSADGATLRNFTFIRMGSAYAASIGITMNKNATLFNLVARQNGNAFSGNARYTFTISAGLMSSCIVTNNQPPNCPGVTLSGSGVIENCYFANNKNRGSSTSWLGGAIDASGGTVRNCTIVNNHCDTGALRATGAAKFYNNIVWGNTTKDGSAPSNWVDTKGTATWINNCIADATSLSSSATISGNFDDDPLLQEDNLHFFRSSPCNGRAAPAYAPAIDLDGNARGDEPSVGCVEYVAGEAIICTVSASADVAVQPGTVTLSATVEGGYTEPLSYAWDFFGTGATDSTGASPVLSDIDVYTPSLTVTDAAGKTATATYPREIVIYGAEGDVFVTNAPNASCRAPYATWETAATNFAEVIRYCQAGGRAVLCDGLHTVDSTLVITKPVTLTSLHGRDQTSITMKGSSQLFILRNAGAIVEGLTVTNCNFNNWARGAGIVVENGSIRDCRFIDCTSNGHGLVTTDGSSTDSHISRCILVNCGQGKDATQGPAGFKLMGTRPVLEDCLVSNVVSRSKSTEYPAGGLYAASGTAIIRNCTFADTVCRQGSPIQVVGGVVVENCILVGNMTNSAASATATPVLHECNDPLVNGMTKMTSANLLHTCLWPSAFDYVGYTGVMVRDPGFKNRAAADLHLRSSSPCLNAGRNNRVPAGATDVEGLPRIIGKNVDLGCFECDATPGTFLFVQ